MDRLIGKVLHDRYCIQSLLGRQTGRRTFVASDLQTELSVVVKLLLFSPDFTWDDLKLFEREAFVLKSLAHPAIPKYLDCFEVETKLGKGFALVQTYIEARSLKEWIQSGRTFSEEELKAIAKELLGILDYLHNRQPPVVHRDIKPSNILLGSRSGNSPGQVYLIDFGSVQTAVHGGTRTIVGTYGYMPPEQFGGQSIPASDLYAIGATLIYLATGQHPDQLPQREMRILFEDSVNLSPHLIDWLKWLTEPSADLRLKSASQALKALEKSNLRKSGLARVAKPAGSKVIVTNTRQMFEILIPPRGFHLGLIPSIANAIVVNYILLGWYGFAFAIWNSGGWIAALFGLLHLYFGIANTWGILFTLLGKVRLRITQSEIFMRSEILGLRCLPSLTAARQNITKIELIPLSYKIEPGGGVNNVAVLPQINIWAGTKKFSLGGEDSSASRNSLTAPELDWLALELSNWLNLPIVQD
ncbi:serine/threonine-protein kinase [Microcoleus vaginatus]|uniref:serine/threonine-protein kinase n=1 Tax=Microcoleus vaginatus TaxID=119532 RepID=UPI00168981A7|nr:serine/threonine protein kinase [Microcoleus sp. FACHB-84]MBD2008215.1 serine/threonine protein kinase [Microcoleus sp. FACHB-45]